MITQIKPIFGFSLKFKSGRTSLCCGSALVIGPTDVVTRKLPFVLECVVHCSVFPKLSTPGLLLSFWLSEKGEVSVRIWNGGRVAQFVAHKTIVLEVYSRVCPVYLTKFDGENKPLCAPVSVLYMMKDKFYWRDLFPRLFDDTLTFGTVKNLEVSYREIHWKTSYYDIPLTNRGLEYEVGEVSPAEASAYLDTLLRKGVIRELAPGEKAFFSPAMFLRKKDGRVRKVVDFRLLNSYSHAWIVPMSGGTIARIRRIPRDWKYFTKVDLESGFSNVCVDDRLQVLFAFSHRGRSFTYRTIPQGWSSASGIFDSRMSSIFSSIGAVSYIDDVLIGGRTPELHDEALRGLLATLLKYGFRVNLSKLAIGTSQVIFLGFDVREGHFSLRSYIDRQCTQLPSANTLSQLRKLIGIFNFARPFVSRMDSVIAPLVDELSKAPSDRMPLARLQESCRAIWKRILTANLELCMCDQWTDSEWTLLVDWSTTGMGYVLLRGNLEQSCVVGIGSKKMGERVSSHLGELLAVKWSLEQVKGLTSGQRVRLLSDSASVVARLLRDSKQEDVVDVRQARLFAWIWQNFPLHSRLIVEHRPGSYNEIADALSRWQESGMIGAIERAQEEPEIPENAVEIIKAVHDEGHYNAIATFLHLKREGHSWKHMRAMVDEVVRCCEHCQVYGRECLSHEISARICTFVGELVYVDFAGPYPLRYGRGRRMLFVMVDGYSRLVKIKIATTATSEVVVDGLKGWIDLVGPITSVQADNAAAFHAHVLKSWLQERSIHIQYTGAYRPHSNGPVERMIGKVKTRLRKLMHQSQKSWVSLIPEVERAINNSINATTQFTPNELAFGMKRDGEVVDSTVSEEWRDQALSRLRNRRERQQDVAVRAREPIAVGQEVLWKVPGTRRKRFWSPVWEGPYRVTGQDSSMFRDIQCVSSGRMRRHVHVRSLKPYFRSDREACWFLRWKDEELSDDDLQANCGDHLDDEGASSDG